MREETVIVKEEIDIDDTKIKLELLDDEETPPLELPQVDGLLEIIEERPNMITVPVHDHKSEDELKFIASLSAIGDDENKQQALFGTTTCVRSNDCECKICNFICKNHLAFDTHQINHQLNRHFCSHGCDCWCNTLEEILEHEYRLHPVGFNSNVSCRICKLVFRSAISLSRHMATHNYERRFVCAICRLDYGSFEELQVHRQYSKKACGRIEYADGQNNIGELLAVGKFNGGSEFFNVKIKAEPVEVEEQQLSEFADIVIKTEFKDDAMEQPQASRDGWSSASIPEQLRCKLRLPAIKKPDIKVETAVHPSPNLQFVPVNKFKQISLPLTATVAKRPNILKPARKNMQTANINPTDASNVLKVLPSNCIQFNLPANTKIVKISTNSTHSSSSSNNNNNNSSSMGSKITTLPANTTARPTATPTIALPVSFANRNAYFSDLSLFESSPESRKIIEDIKNQIRNIEQTCPLPGSVLEVSKKVSPPVVKNLPNQVFELQLTRSSSAKLRGLRMTYPSYVFQWECPTCGRCYEQYSAFSKHLIFSHNVQQDNLADIVVKVKAYKKILPTTTVSIKNTPDVPKTTTPPVSATVAATSDQSAAKQNSTTETVPALTTATPSPISTVDSQPKRIKDLFRSPQYPCEDCSKSFTTVGALRIHKMIHTGELPHKCDYCDKRFRTPGQVRVHQRRHTGEKPFKCKVCSLAFTHRETLISHLSRHIGMKRYKCYGCDKNFVVVSGLRAHRRLRPDTCGKVKFTARAHGPRVRVIRGEVFFESHPTHNGYLRSEDPLNILSEMNHVDMEPDATDNVVS